MAILEHVLLFEKEMELGPLIGGLWHNIMGSEYYNTRVKGRA